MLRRNILVLGGWGVRASSGLNPALGLRSFQLSLRVLDLRVAQRKRIASRRSLMYYWRDKATSRLVAHEVKDGNATSVCGLVSVITKRAKRRYRATPDIPASWTLCAHCKSGQVFSTKHTGSTLQPAIRQGMAAKPSKPPRIRGEGLLFVQTDAFLDSYEWRQLRMVAIKQYGRACMCCGATPGHGLMIHVDHIKPRKYHPELALTLANLQILCEVCNHGKGNWDDTDWRQADQPDDPVAQSHMAEMRIVN